MVGWFLNVLVSNWAISRTGPKTEVRQFLHVLPPRGHTETERGENDFCLSRSHCTGTDQTSRERAPGTGIESTTSWLGVARTIDTATVPPPLVFREWIGNNVIQAYQCYRHRIQLWCLHSPIGGVWRKCTEKF